VESTVVTAPNAEKVARYETFLISINIVCETCHEPIIGTGIETLAVLVTVIREHFDRCHGPAPNDRSGAP
jgi:hypothetical protein